MIGASRPPTGSPMGWPTFFFFFGSFFSSATLLVAVCCQEKMDWAEILHNHTYGHASGQSKNIFSALIFH